MVRAFIIMLLFKKPFLSHSPPAIENEKHAALKTNKPVNSGNKYMWRAGTRTGQRGHYGFCGLYSSGQFSIHYDPYGRYHGHYAIFNLEQSFKTFTK